MNKLDRAHEYAVKLLEHSNMTPEEVTETSWFIADLMQEEYDKRNNVRLENNKKLLEDVENKLWQPDWSVVPDNMIYFAVDANGDGYFYEYKPYIAIGYDYWGDVDSKYEGLSAKEYDDHNYKGDWKQSLRERPNCNKLRSGYVQQIPRPFFTNEDEIGSLDKLKEDLKSSLNSNLKSGSKEGMKKFKVEGKQSSCNCPHWKGSSFFMEDTFICNDCGWSVTI